MTVHQLIGRARFAIERYTKSLADFPDQSGVAMDLELARIALAALTATQPLSDAERAELQDRRKADSEPVMYQARMWNPEYEEWDPWAECNENAFVVFSQEADRGEGMEVRKLYAAPQPAPVVPLVPDDVSGPLAHAYKELTPTFMRNHIAVFERYGIAPNDSSTVIQALRIALDGIERRAAMLQAEPVTTANKLGNSPVIPDGSEDTKRLNWLDAQNKRLNEYYGTSYGWKFDANFQRNAMMLNDSNYPVMTVRQAIDEAIAAAPQEVKGE
ncbi:hypothetical protein VU643_22530 [Klebsiella aerogenes]|uniref:hypothetical protein n=1 Tax=Klebsiella aerogenes TaxID=548 RepID=UPI003CEB0341